MPTTGTYTFAPDIAELLDDAWERCGVDPSTVTARHLRSARRSMELMFAEWAARGIHLWSVVQETLPLEAGVATYDTPDNTITVLEMVVRRQGVDTEVWPMSRDEYLAIPNKLLGGLPSRYYFDRQRSIPTLTFWTVPENDTDQIIYYRLRRLQDVGPLAAEPEVPYLWYEAFTSGMAAKLAEKYAPEREVALAAKAAYHFGLCNVEDRQRTPTRTMVRYGRR